MWSASAEDEIDGNASLIARLLSSFIINSIFDSDCSIYCSRISKSPSTYGKMFLFLFFSMNKHVEEVWRRGQRQLVCPFGRRLARAIGVARCSFHTENKHSFISGCCLWQSSRYKRLKWSNMLLLWKITRASRMGLWSCWDISVAVRRERSGDMPCSTRIWGDGVTAVVLLRRSA